MTSRFLTLPRDKCTNAALIRPPDTKASANIIAFPPAKCGIGKVTSLDRNDGLKPLKSQNLIAMMMFDVQCR